MKNLIRLLSCFSLLFSVGLTVSKAQLINPEFTINNGNDMAAPALCTPSFTFEPGSSVTGPGTVYGWYRTAGTPYITNDCQGTLGIIVLTGNQHGSQHIAQEYQFKAGVTYNICYKLRSWDLWVGELGFYAVENLVQRLPQSFPSPTCSNDPPGSRPSFGNSYPITTPQPSPRITPVGEPCDEQYSSTFTFTAPADYNYIYIAVNGDHDEAEECFVELDFVDIRPVCPTHLSSLTFGDGTSGPIAATTHNADNIFVGSSFGSFSTAVTNNNNAVTTLEAKNKIEIQQNFMASAVSNNYFLAQINPNECIDDCFYNPSRSKGGKKTPQPNTSALFIGLDNPYYLQEEKRQYQTLSINTKKTKTNLNIHPNPTTGSFTLTMPQSGKYTVRVMNMMGAMVYEAQFDGEQQKSIQLNQGLPAGTYTIQVTGEGLRHVEKLILTK